MSFVPDTPEALFEQLAEPTLRQLYRNYDELEPRHQKLVRLVHTELTKGELTDLTFHEFTAFVLTLWRAFNGSAMAGIRQRLTSNDEIEERWIDQAVHHARIDQMVTAALSTLEDLPSYDPDGPDDQLALTQYLLRPQS